MRHSGARTVNLIRSLTRVGQPREKPAKWPAFAQIHADRSVGQLFVLALLVDLALGRLGDADGIGPRHRLLQTLLQLSLRSVVRLLVRGRVLHIRIAATLPGRGMLHGILLLGEFSPA